MSRGNINYLLNEDYEWIGLEYKKLSEAIAMANLIWNNKIVRIMASRKNKPLLEIWRKESDGVVWGPKKGWSNAETKN